MQKKLTRIGWIGKSYNGNVREANKGWVDDHALPGVFATKGRKHDWSKKDWPPTKVVVTVELHNPPLHSEQKSGERSE